MGKTIKQVWLFFSITISSLLAFAAFLHPLKFVPMAELLATIIAILIGVSLAISAVLIQPPQLNRGDFSLSNDAERTQKILNENYESMLEGQKYLFWFYYISLVLAVGLKFLDIYFGGEANPEFYLTKLFKLTACAFAFISGMALLWSATLPTLLHQVNSHKMRL